MEFIQLIAAYSEHTVMENPGAKEIYKTLHYLAEQKKTPIWVTQDRVIYDTTLGLYDNIEVPVRIATLSPSDLAVTKAKITFKSLLPEVNKPKRGLSSHKTNDSSVVTYVEIGEISLLLGGDIEVTDDKNAGWDCILNNRSISTKKSLIYKVSHHGSQNGHHDSIWQDLLDSNPISILTPFRRGSVVLPTNEDLKRLFTMNGVTYLTSQNILPRVKRRSRTVEKTIKNATRKHTRWSGRTGHIKLRVDITQEISWDIELSENSTIVDEATLA